MLRRKRTRQHEAAVPPPTVLPPGEQEAYLAEVKLLVADMARTGLWLGCNGRYFGPPSISHVRGLRAFINSVEERCPEIVQSARGSAGE